MAMQFITVSRGEQPSDGYVVIGEHLYLTEDRSRVVKEGDPASRWLWASPGTSVPRAEALRLGAIQPELEVVVEAEVEENTAPAEDPPAEQAEEKQAKQVPNKARKAAPNKAATPAEDK